MSNIRRRENPALLKRTLHAVLNGEPEKANTIAETALREANVDETTKSHLN